MLMSYDKSSVLFILITVIVTNYDDGRIALASLSCLNVSSADRPAHCKKACVRDEQCKKSNKKCLCDGPCGLSCVNPSSTCHPLVDLKNGYIRTPGDFTFGSNVEYGCNQGYVLVGPSQRRCQSNREWSGSKPECRLLKKCGQPPEIPYAQHDGSSYSGEYELDSEVRYTCVHGYHRYNDKGISIAKCLLNRMKVAQWFGPDISCKARSCPDPGNIMNGIRKGELLYYPHSIEIVCLTGYRLVGSSLLKCLSNGQWSDQKPHCKPIECKWPSDPLHGKVLGSSLTYQSRVTYSCDDGYRLVGQVQRICLAEGEWAGNEPKCEEIRCPTLPMLHNGYIEGEDTHFGAIVVFRCLEGMNHIGAPYSKCGEHAKWSHPIPTCLSGCRIPEIANGNVIGSDLSMSALHGDSLQILCTPKHEITEAQNTILCRNGTWSHVPSCIPVRCKTWPTRIANAKVVFTKSSHGALARYECNTGFRPSNKHNTVKCLYGEWSQEGKSFSCKPILCEHPLKTFGSLEGGQIMLEGQMGAYGFADYIAEVEEGRSIAFQCKKGFILLGSPKATCVSGSWMPRKKPKCVSQTHPMIEGQIAWLRRRRSLSNDCLPMISDHRRKVIEIKEGDSTSQILIVCREGFHLENGSNYGTLFCRDGQWVPENVQCLPDDCHIPTLSQMYFLDVRSERILQSGDPIEHGYGVRMVCMQGHQLIGNDILECNHGVFIGNAGDCRPRSCELTNRGGRFSDNHQLELSHGQEIILFCNDQVHHFLKCQFGELKPNIFCSVKESAASLCQRPNDDQEFLAYRMVQINDRASKIELNPSQTTFPNGTVIQYVCHSEIANDEANAIMCIDGEWVTKLLHCAASSLTDSVAKKTSYVLHGMCKMPMLDSAYKIMNNPGTQQPKNPRFARGTLLKIGCAIGFLMDDDDVMELRCRRGSWIASGMLHCKSDVNACEYRMDEHPNVIAFSSKHKRRVTFNQKFPEDAELLLSCQQLGLQQLLGNSVTVCRNGSWLPKIPKCALLNSNSSKDGSPPIRVLVERGLQTVSPHGSLLVNSSSTLHLQCIYQRSKGEPKWEISSTYRKYPQMWTTISDANQSVDAFQLTISATQPDDSGFFHCILPNGRRNTIKVVVKDNYCEKLVESSRLRIFYTNVHLYVGTVAQFSCEHGFHIDGPRSATCLGSGKWSHNTPNCQALQCPPLMLTDEAQNVVVSSFRSGGTAHFYCSEHQKTIGQNPLKCLPNGEWSTKMPICDYIKCSKPPVPKNGVLLSEQKQYNKQEMVIFGCKAGYMLTGMDYAICGADGNWSFVNTQCVRYCRFPGKPTHGDSTTPAKSYYLTGEKVVYYCTSAEYRLTSENVLECLVSGKWSRRLPQCVALKN